jgi:hypothetical protein
MLTPCATANFNAVRAVAASPAWKPQAMFADVMRGITSASKGAPSPRSQLRSTDSCFTMKSLSENHFHFFISVLAKPNRIQPFCALKLITWLERVASDHFQHRQRFENRQCPDRQEHNGHGQPQRLRTAAPGKQSIERGLILRLDRDL